MPPFWSRWFLGGRAPQIGVYCHVRRLVCSIRYYFRSAQLLLFGRYCFSSQYTRRPQSLIPNDEMCSAKGHCGLPFILPRKIVQISCLEAVESEEGWLFIMNRSKTWTILSIRQTFMNEGKPIWIFEGILGGATQYVQKVYKSEMNVYLYLATSPLYRLRIMADWNLQQSKWKRPVV